MSRKHGHPKRRTKSKENFHHFYPKPYRNLDHNPNAGEYLDREFHTWLHMNYSNYELSNQSLVILSSQSISVATLTLPDQLSSNSWAARHVSP